VTILDARGLACPLPLTLARRRMAELEPGDTLRVLATDPEAPVDLAAWATDEGHGFRDLSADPAAGDHGSERSPDGAWLTLELRKG
jgi:tRNA 2-thiouridine synthesizing protein A